MHDRASGESELLQLWFNLIDLLRELFRVNEADNLRHLGGHDRRNNRYRHRRHYRIPVCSPARTRRHAAAAAAEG